MCVCVCVCVDVCVCDFMGQSFWKANCQSASQFLSPSKNFLPLFPILSQLNHIHILNLFKIHFIIILPPTPSPLTWSLPLRFSTRTFARISLLFHTCYKPYPSNPSSFYNQNNIWWSICWYSMELPQHVGPIFLQPPLSSCTTVFSKPCSLPLRHVLTQSERPSSTPSQNNHFDCCFLKAFKILGWKTDDSEMHGSIHSLNFICH